jgi:hypothetical protein
METKEFLRLRETFGLETAQPWSLPALRLLFSTPRAYEDLVHAWNRHYPGTKRALHRLVELGFVEYQPGLILDTKTGLAAPHASRKVARYRATALGSRQYTTFNEDLRTFEEIYPRTQPRHLASAVEFLGAFVLEDSHARFGQSANHAIAASGLPPRLARWWFARFRQNDWIVQLPEAYADVREVVPAHWRITRPLCRQIETVLNAFPQAPQTIRAEFRLKRSRFLDDIDPRRVGLTGATDFDHDVTAQRILAAMLLSPRYAPEGLFRLEPRLALPIDNSTRPWLFTPSGPNSVTYQPDAVLTVQNSRQGRVQNRRVVLEYERYQTRRDAWSHVERFLGWLHTHTLPFERATLCFVVDSDQRLRTYVQLLEAFADYTMDNPERVPANTIQLAATTVPRLLTLSDPLDFAQWSRINLTTPEGSDTEVRPVLHDPEHSPYGDYFG